MDIQLSKLTKPKIIQWAKSNGFASPTHLNKSQLILYIEGQYMERLLGISKNDKAKQIIQRNKIQYKQFNPDIDWLVHLHEYGWAVAPLENWDTHFINNFLEFFEKCSPQFKKDDKTTWTKNNLPEHMESNRGIIKHYIGHEEWVWKIRELCVSIFSKIWNTDQLLSSYDGGCFLLPSPETPTITGWIHHDTPKGFTDFCCVQGVVNFLDNGVNDGGLLLVEGSRDIFDEYMTKYPSSGIIWEKANIQDPLLIDKQLIKICAPAGHIILFDSRMFHCNIKPTSNNIRMCTYVSMMPRYGATPAELIKRINIYENGKMTGHWPYGPGFYENTKNPRYGDINKPENIQVAELSNMRKMLIGY